MSKRWSQPTECGKPKWKSTKRGKRCTSICKDGRWRFVKKEACEGGAVEEEHASPSSPTSPDVMEFSRLGMEPIEPMPLFPLLGPEGTGKKRPRGRRRRRSG